jgi:multidrug efflux pump subunit AcrA (membrane-fusion protein)
VTVKVALETFPEAMTIGAAVSGSTELPGAAGVVLPFTALTLADGLPAVWIVDPRDGAVSIRPVTLGRYATGTVVVADGLADGEHVVTAGTQLLRPGQKVEIVEGDLP